MTASLTRVPGSTKVAEDRWRLGILRGSSGIPKVTGPNLGLYSVGRSDHALFGDHMTVMLALSLVPFRGKENMTVQERVKFIESIRAFRRTLGQWFFVGTREAGLFVGCNAWVLKSSTPSAHYRQVLGGAGLALGELVVPWCIWVSSVKLPEFLQTTY